MSDTDKSNGKQAMLHGEERKIWQILPSEGCFGYGTLLEKTLPSSCKTEENLLTYLGQSKTITNFMFTRKLKILAIAHCPGVSALMEHNFYAAKITGEPISGPLTVVCISDEQIVNMDEFFQLCKESGMPMRDFKLGTEKQFPGLEGDMLHRLVRTNMKHEKRKKPEEHEASPDFGSGAAASGSAPAEGDVRRSDRTRKRKQIFDPSHERVKREPQED
jgi:hypothetical protein